MDGVRTAYYLIHSMGTSRDYEALDRAAAANFAAAARHAGVARIIYLGGLGGGSDLSSHLASRQEVGEILRASGVATVEFRASIVIGSGSASYEAVRAIVETLPVMITPRRVNTSDPARRNGRPQGGAAPHGPDPPDAPDEDPQCPGRSPLLAHIAQASHDAQGLSRLSHRSART